ncbi:outer membrane protein OmpA-like peptidoglycan-associated protein [Capnocytophaga leadbetteri]|uniref:Outer membrane protein OmpA-like peptidoglycan-associated protein n=2 Tax=Capnocytophaga leadbetteri TaxID=327575 RepID=A0A2T5XUZ5_9FLAO|nr:OmpA family protein [Capnocytophaga leadbetteri]PTX07118.1 outer membrane protein OmpA-like peptidoglycan-associated protein [Capnocytophaga leadbetteri]
MKYIYQIIGGLLLCVQTINAQIAPTPKKTEIVMTVDELRYLLEQIGKAELTTLRDKQLDSMLSAVNYKTEQMSSTSVVINEYRLVKAAAVSPTVVGTTSSTIISRTASNTAIARTASNTTIARTANPAVVRTATNTAITQRSVVPAAVVQTQTTAAIAQQLAQLSGTVEQLRKQQQLLLATLAANTGMVAAKSNIAPTAANAQATAVGTQATVATTTATTATAGYAPIVVQSVTATGVPIQISAEKRSELEQLLAAYGHKKALLYFANNKTIPLAYDPTIIDEMVTMLQAHPELSILLEGYASAVGSAAYNNVLSMERAVAVAQILNAKGISNERILTAFKGVDPQATPAQARRVELRVVIRSY